MDRFKLPCGATIYIRRKTWWLDYVLDGKRIRETLGTHDPTEAMMKASMKAGGLTEGMA